MSSKWKGADDETYCHHCHDYTNRRAAGWIYMQYRAQQAAQQAAEEAQSQQVDDLENVIWARANWSRCAGLV
ncbi:MAG: hypothetical protein R2932_06985 [Caldilineaceae bacterium]